MKYNFIKQRGMGGFGVVDMVETKNGDLFARKTFRVSPLLGADEALEKTSKKRFIKEAKYQKEIKHRNIVPVLESYLDKEPPYIIMPLAEASLNDDIISGVIHKGNFIEAIADVMAGLEEIHELGIYHRDLKPSNILRFKASVKKDRDFYAISDFGLMSMKETSVTTLTATGTTRNSDFYTAPEITIDLTAASIQSDIYSVGCLIHDFIATNPARVPCGEINESNEYGSILSGCTRLDPKRRFKDISSLRDALASLDIKNLTTSTATGNEIVQTLDDEVTLQEGFVYKLVHFLTTQKDNDDRDTVLKKLTLSHIIELKQFPLQFKQIGLVYAEWVRKKSFTFEFCDTLCNRMMKFVSNSEIDLQCEGLMALLYMGTSHNRFYVERSFFNFVSETEDEQLIKRLNIEIRVDGESAVEAFYHLKRSISASLSDLPKIIVNAINVSKK